MIKDFAHDVESVLAKQKPGKLPDHASEGEKREFKRVIDEMGRLVEASKGKSKVSITVGTESRLIGDFLLGAARIIKSRTFLAEMALSYLISYLEAFAKDLAKAILVADTRMLRTASSITFEELSKHRSMKSVWHYAADCEAEAMGFGSIDDIAAYYKKRFSCDLTAFKDWQAIRESVYRRNLIVHNRGRVNEIYRRKTGYSGADKHVSTDIAYVEASATRMVAFFRYVEQMLLKK